MDKDFPHYLLDDPSALASYKGWSEDEYRDLLAVYNGELSRAAFREKYSWEKAILVLDLTGFTQTAMRQGEVSSLMRIVEAHQVCLPVLQESGADVIRSFADNLVALFDDAGRAVDSALEIHNRVDAFAAFKGAGEDEPASACIGIGYGRVLAMGPNLAQGDEMNRASRLGEDIARGGETLITENVRGVVELRPDVELTGITGDEAPFPYYSISFRR